MIQTRPETRPAPPAAQIGGPEGVLTEDQVRAFVPSSSARRPRRAQLSWSCRRHPQLPDAAAAGCGARALAGRVTRLTVLVALAPTRGWGRPSWPGTSAMSPARSPSATPVLPWHQNGGTRRPSLGRDHRRRPDRRALRGPLPAVVDVRLNRAVVEHDVTRSLAGVPPRGRRLLRRQQVLLSWGLQPGGHQPVALAGALITSAEIIGTPEHPGPGADRRGRLAGARGQVRVLRRGPVGVQGPALGGVRRAPGGLGGGCRRCRRDPCPLSGGPGAPGAVGRPGHVPRHVDRGQGLLQGRAGRRRWRPGGAVRPPRPRDQRHASGGQGGRLPLPGLLREAMGPLPFVPWGVLAHSTHLRGARHLRRGHRPSSTGGSRSPWPPASPRNRCGR